MDTIESLREKYKDILNNNSVIQVSRWREPNTHAPVNEEEFLTRTLSNIEALSQKIYTALAEKQEI